VSTEPHPYDHVRSDGTTVDAGIYRVVGTPDDRITLLRVADEGGRRVHEGEVVSVDHDEYGSLEPAANPDRPSLLVSLALALGGGGLVLAEILADLLTMTAGAVGVDALADVLVVACALVFAVGVRRLWSLRRF
jgi:hypothetical protein